MIETEGIRYTGSKKVIIPRILEIIKPLDVKLILDGFAGTTRVGQALKQSGYSVHSNDLAEYSRVFGQCYLINNKSAEHFQEKLEYLSHVPGVFGYFSENYGGKDNGGSSKQSDGKKRIWQLHNTMMLDAIREEIDKISDNEIEKSIFLTSLILALDKVDNTLGHQVAYLDKWSPRSYQKINLKMPRLIAGDGNYQIWQQDVKKIDGKYDLAYFDPPYGTNNQVTKTTRVRYASYYHLWTTVCKNDKPEVSGAANRRKDVASDKCPGAISAYESVKYDVVVNEIESLIKLINAKYILFSYSNKSKVHYSDLIDIFSSYDIIEEYIFEHKENVMKRCTSNKQWLGDQSQNYEFLFLIRK